MRKTLFLLTTLLSGSLASYQEAEAQNAGEFEFRVIPRFEVNPYIPAGKDAKGSCDLGSTSLYTQLEGSIGEHFYYYLSNHWLSTDLESLYVIEEDGGDKANLFRSDCTSWLDMGYVGFTFGSWDISLGKDMVVVGTFEEDAMDVESHANLNTYFWNAAQVYQWGAKAAWTTPSESSQFFLQLTSSPFSTRPFGHSWYEGNGGHLKTFTGGWYGSIGNWETVWSANMMEYSTGNFLGMLGLGNRLSAGDFTFTLDFLARSTSLNELFNREMSLSGSVRYELSPRAEVFVKGGYERARGHDFFAWEGDEFVPTVLAGGDSDYVFGGAGIHYYPIKGDRSLRIHAVAAANNFSRDLVSVSVGVMYDFDLTGFIARGREARKESRAIDARNFKAI